MIATLKIEKILTDVLDTAYNDLKSGNIQYGFQLLITRLAMFQNAYPAELIRTLVRDICLKHPINTILQQNPITKRAHDQPRGYAGDAELIDLIYGHGEATKGISYEGRELQHLSVNCFSSQAVKWRAHHLADCIETIAQKKEKAINVFSVASGHLRELAYIKNPESIINRFIALDQDIESNKFTRASYDHSFLHVVDASVLDIIKGNITEDNFDFIYSAGLFDYLNAKIAAKLIVLLYDKLNKGGELLIPNFAIGLHERAYMETFMKWDLIYRNEEDMLDLCEGMNLSPDQVSLYRDPNCTVVYLRILK